MIDYIGTENELKAGATTLLGKVLEAVEANSIKQNELLNDLRTLDALLFLISQPEESREMARECRKAALQ